MDGFTFLTEKRKEDRLERYSRICAFHLIGMDGYRKIPEPGCPGILRETS